MPRGKTFSKTLNAWVDVEKEKKIDYADNTQYDEDAWGLLISYWRAFPDKLLDILESETPMYTLEITQRMMIRAFCTANETMITGARGMTKTFAVLTSAMVMGILFPGIKRRYFAPSLKQAAEIAGLVYKDIITQYPGLGAHWQLNSSAEGSFEISTPFGSVISINVMRGDTAHAIIGEEIAQERDSGEPFNFDKFEAMLPAIRGNRMVNRKRDPFYPQYQQSFITSAGRRQNKGYEYRKTIYRNMIEGNNSVCLDIPSEVSVLSGIRDIAWYEKQTQTLTPESFLREMGSIWTGVSDNPVIRDSVLTESKTLSIMEDRHCGNPNVIYIVAYDVSFSDGAGNAKCATAVLKCEKQTDYYKRDKFLKSLVYVYDNPPPSTTTEQALALKEVWRRYCFDGAETYIAIDANSYGRGVLEELHKDLLDGLPPMCCMEHDLQEMELPGALPVIYPIRAGTSNTAKCDSDSEMLRYAEVEFENRNVELLVTNIHDGVKAYKQKYRIKDADADVKIAIPYHKTAELCGQIANLMKKVSGTGVKETRISKHIQRDMWSATKYALRLAQIIETKQKHDSMKKDSGWADEFNKPSAPRPSNMRQIGRRGGNLNV